MNKVSTHDRFILVVEGLVQELLDIAATAPDEMTTFEKYALKRLLSLLGREDEYPLED